MARTLSKTAFSEINRRNRVILRDYFGKVVFESGSVAAAVRWCKKNGWIYRA